MYKKVAIWFIALLTFFAALSIRGMAAAVKIECEDYFATNMPASALNYTNTNYSNGAGIKLSTAKAPENGEQYYIDYSVTVDKAGAYKMVLSSYPILRGYYSELEIKINDRNPVNVCTKGIIGEELSNGLTKTVINYLSGFKTGDNTVRFIVKGTRPIDGNYIATMDCFSLEKAAWGVSDMFLEDMSLNIAEFGDELNVKLVFSESVRNIDPITINVYDYNDEIVHTGEIAFTKDKWYSECSYGITDCITNPGFYSVKAVQNSKNLASITMSVVKPYSQRNIIQNSPYGIDSALSIIAPYDLIDGQLRAIKLSGAGYMRDRLRMDAFIGENYTYSGGYSEVVYKKAKQQGIKIHAMLMVPPVTQDMSYTVNGVTYSEKLTTDFNKLYNKSKAIAQYFGDNVFDYEILNEPENNIEVSNSETGDKFASFTKAIALGIYDSGTTAKITSSGFSPARTEVMDLFLRNGAQNFVNVLTYHNHTSYKPDEIIQHLKHGQVTNFNNMLNDFNLNDREQWLDEAGISMSDAAENLSIKKQIRQADYTVISHADAFSKGADKYFAYLFNHKDSSFSWFSRDFTGPNRVYSAYCAMTDILGEAKYLGKMNNLNGNAEGYVFKNGDRKIILMYSESDQTVTLNVPDAQVFDIQGNKIKESAQSLISVDLSAQPLYVCTNGDVEGLYTAEAISDKCEVNLEFTPADRVIFYWDFPKNTRGNSKFDGYSLTAGETQVNLKITNLNDKPISGILNLSAFGGWNVITDETQINLAAYGTQTISCKILLSDAVKENIKSAVVARVDFGENGKTVSTTDIVKKGDITPTCINKLSEITESAESWKKSASAGTTAYVTENSDGGLNFNVDFSKTSGDKWYYPDYSFNVTMDFSDMDGIVIKYKTNSDDFEPNNITSRVFLRESYGANYISTYNYYYKKGEHSWYIPWSSFVYKNGADDDMNLSINDIAGISIGLNSPEANIIPEYTILSVSTYSVEQMQKLYSKFDESTIEVNSPYLNISTDSMEIPVNMPSVKAYVDSIHADTSYSGKVLTVAIPDGIKYGEHVLRIAYENEDTHAFCQNVTFIGDGCKYALSLAAECVPSQDGSSHIRTEGENFSQNTFKTKNLHEYDGVTNGTYQRNYTDTTTDGAEYVIVYDITVPNSGMYKFSGTVSTQNTQWYSKAALIFNNQNVFDTSAATKNNAVNDRLTNYTFGEVYLNKGLNRLTVSVTEPRTSSKGGYYFYIDYFDLDYCNYSDFIPGENTVNITIESNRCKSGTVDIVFATYHGDKLAEVILKKDISVYSDKKTSLSFEADIPQNSDKVKIFCVDSLTSLVPLCEKTEFNANDVYY